MHANDTADLVLTTFIKQAEEETGKLHLRTFERKKVESKKPGLVGVFQNKKKVEECKPYCSI